MKKIFLVLFAALLIACSAFSAFAEEASDVASDVSTEAVSDVSTEAVSDVSTEAVSDESSEISNDEGGTVSNEESSKPSDEASSDASKEEGDVEELKIDFAPSRFVDNLSKMGIGMLGIFIVMGVVIIVTNILNKVTSKK